MKKPKKPVVKKPTKPSTREVITPDENGRCPGGYYNNGKGECVLDS